MAITIATDKIAIQSILTDDPYLIEYLQFSPDEFYRVRATDDILDEKDKQQIFIYNVSPEGTINPLIYGIVYEIDVSVPFNLNGTADLAIEQIMALLNGVEISNTHKLELSEAPTVLSSDNSLYQVGVRFVCYETTGNKPKIY